MDPDSWVEQYQREAAERLGRAQGLKENLTNATGSAASPQGEVKLTVGPGGNLVDLEFSEKAGHLPPQELAKLVLRTAQQAHHLAGQAMLEIMQPVIGSTDAMEYLKTQLPPEPPAEEPNPFVPRRTQDDPLGRTRGDDGQDDDGFGSILR